ncbi:MAG: hypothetical protein M3O30_15185 [Planctomycetota bacterium]|nr:hypothetical protein [Planctomycetota bacterium]
MKAIIVAAAMGVLTLPTTRVASADSDGWIGTSGGNWTDGTQWSSGLPPAGGQDVLVTNAFGGTQTITFDSGAGLTYSSLTVSATGGGTNVFLVGANSFNVSGGEYVGDSGISSNGTGVFVQSGGSNSVLGTAGLNVGVNASDLGSYAFSGGNLSSGVSEVIGVAGIGNFSQSGGTNALSVNGSLNLGFSAGATGNYTLSGGTLSASAGAVEYIGYNGVGNFNQTGGLHPVTGQGFNYIYLGYNSGATGTYTLGPGAVLSTNPGAYLNENVGYNGVGIFNQSGGTNTFDNLYLAVNYHSTGTYTLGDNAFLSAGQEIIGSRGIGAFNQAGGTNSTRSIGLGGLSGTYTLSGTGNLNIGPYGSENIGGGNGNFIQTGGVQTLTTSAIYLGQYSNGTSRFNQSGGTNSLVASTLYLGFGAGSTASYSLGAGASLIATGISYSNSYEYIGDSGIGNFNQTGGTNSLNSFDGAIYVGYNIGSTGNYLLSGGSLQFTGGGAEYIGRFGVGNFNQTGGTNLLSGTRLMIENGTYTLGAGASLTVTQAFPDDPGIELIAGQAAFYQTGGANTTVNADLDIGTSGTGTYDLTARGETP